MTQLALDGLAAPITSSLIRRFDVDAGTLSRGSRSDSPAGCVGCRNVLHPVVILDRGLLWCPAHAPAGARALLDP